MGLVPDYLKVDYNTATLHLKNNIRDNAVFEDVDYEGANITALIELQAYIVELNRFFVNKIAMNVFEETSNIYETSHQLAKQKGYDAKGPRASSGAITITIDNKDAELSNGDNIVITPWSELTCINTAKYDEEDIVFATTSDVQKDDSLVNVYSFTIAPSGFVTTSTAGASGSFYEVDIPVKQGKVRELTGIYGRDVVDNQLLLPRKTYAYDDDINDNLSTIQLTVDDEVWERVDNYYDEITGLFGENTKIYKFEYDKYERNLIRFSGQRARPGDSESIKITLLESFGKNGNVGPSTVNGIASPDVFIYNNQGGPTRNGKYITGSNISVTNKGATTGGTDPETITQIRDNSRNKLHQQYRNVTRNDYVSDLQERSDVITATAYGEQEIAPSGGDTREYNKVYLTIVPDVWGSNTINYDNETIVRNINSVPVSATIKNPTSYSQSWKARLAIYIEPKKMLTTYEVFVVPNLVYFFFDIELRAKRSYDYVAVKTDTLNKLIWYFDASNRNFGELIDFMDITNYLLDPEEVSNTDNFANIKGIDNLVFRDIDTNVVIYEPNGSLSPRYYPQYTIDSGDWAGDNKIRRIQLDFDQFPSLSPTITNFIKAEQV